MYINSDRLTYVELSLIHLSDWTSRVNFDYEYVVMKSDINALRGYSLEFSILKVRDKDSLKRIMRIIRSSDAIIDVVGFRELNYGYPKRIAIVLKNSLNDSTRYKAWQLSGFETKDHIVNGIENWGFIFMNKDSIETFRRQLEDSGRVLSFRVRDIDLNDAFNLVNSRSIHALLTKNELKVLKAAHKGGFFDEPRGINLINLSKALNLSPSTVNHELRNALRKLLSQYLGLNQYPYE
ncbi:helix-turn-helix domain-containing protein [Caldivirga maquilingensis]|uniref:Bacterio-opsin activator HTH domain protein n=1 Tax=Caldivirga maquilingensis (strain ATCC 700844 / DSM 13496 / JCM 10307 / IC-167) TaxID=397948 RepID=A8M929_CALMQ|nr:helix-turn-helix domain-containing protein [Caldivirga maquilingensis]ABW02248.1 Bacterio-opsin activator HTH domain protein [Caldivirga maquilingensis IC-167]